MIYRTFTALGLEDFQIRLNNRKVLSGLFDLLGLGDKATDVMRTIDKLEKIGKEKVLEVLTGEFAVAEDAASKLLEVLESADPMEALETLKGQNELLDTGIQELSQVVRHMGDFGVPETHFKVDLTSARGLDYTGTVYETPDDPASGDRLHLLRRLQMTPGGVLHRQTVARRWYFHWPDPAVLCAGGAGACS